MASILQERAKFMAVRTAKASAIKGDETNSEIAECWEEEVRSSMIQINPTNPVEDQFHAAFVYMEHSPDPLGFG